MICCIRRFARGRNCSTSGLCGLFVCSFCANCVGVESFSESLDCSRWKAMPLPLTLSKNASMTTLKREDNFYPYAISKRQDVDFWVNFADKALFAYYGDDLFAQDEVQTAGT